MTQTHNPWLNIPASDYEGHMSSPDVGQLQILNRLFKTILDETPHESLAVLGCTTGNGFEHIDFTRTTRVLAIDINPDYLAIARERFIHHRINIEWKCADLQSEDLGKSQFDLVHGALIFEYIDPELILPQIAAALKETGVMSVVLQLPGNNLPPVSQTPYKSLEKLAPIMKLIDRETFTDLAFRSGLNEQRGEIITLQSGKEFFFGIFTK
jgi:SAM-dependent methyltransferase